MKLLAAGTAAVALVLVAVPAAGIESPGNHLAVYFAMNPHEAQSTMPRSLAEIGERLLLLGQLLAGLFAVGVFFQIMCGIGGLFAALCEAAIEAVRAFAKRRRPDPSPL